MADLCTPTRKLKRTASAADLSSPSPSKHATPNSANATPIVSYDLNYKSKSPIEPPSRAKTLLYFCNKIIPCCPYFIYGPDICLKCDRDHPLSNSIPNDATAVLVVGQPFVQGQPFVKRQRVVKQQTAVQQAAVQEDVVQQAAVQQDAGSGYYLLFKPFQIM